MPFKWVMILSLVTALTLVGWRDTPMQSVRAASDASEEVQSEAAEAVNDEEVQSEADEAVGRVETLDDLLAEVAARVPGFGGLFIGPNGALYINLLDEQLARAAEGGIETIFGPERLPLGSIRVLRRQYSFLQLKDWHERMMPEVLGLPGVIFTDIDEAENLLRIGIERQELQGSVEAQLASLGISRAAVLIEETEPIKLMSHALRSRLRPLVGGLQISFPISSTS
jgi:hypothetical protein